VVAGGVENMSMVPLACATLDGEAAGHGHPRGGYGWRARFGDVQLHQIGGAELIAEKWAITRGDMEELALASHERAIAARDNGRFEGEVTPYGGVARDEGPRRVTTREKMAALKTLTPDGLLSAEMASQISDGASAVGLRPAMPSRAGRRPAGVCVSVTVTNQVTTPSGDGSQSQTPSDGPITLTSSNPTHRDGVRQNRHA